ncbi:MAG: type III-B CRISPR module-associated protein Cmr3 [Fimbriimonadaceae bacterium]|nr:type III-B CRISPR module-associated protein Cmr3 [Fimbriimonadaceae bacterium]
MNHYTIQPLDPLVLGDGRPFSTDPGALAAGGLLLPMPSTLAGAVRTAIGRAQTPPDWATLRTVPVHGPLFTANGTVRVPMPADAVLMSEGDELRLARARPTELGDGEGTDLPEGLTPVGLPSGTNELEPSKHDPPRWMSLDQLAAWYADGKLFDTEGQYGVWKVPLKDGKPPWDDDSAVHIEKDLRVHVGISHATQAAEKGMLYQTTGAAYRQGQALLVRTDGSVPSGAMPLGGERRLGCLSEGGANAWTCPDGVREGLKTATKVAMVLATPAVFELGFGPQDLPNTLNATVALVAAAMSRREAVSGWDLAKGGPKPVRWLAPAGSVYWLEIPSGEGEKLADRWLQPVSDHPDDRRDGFGLAVFFPTTWGTH